MGALVLLGLSLLYFVDPGTANCSLGM